MAFNGFSADERAWLASQKLGRMATLSPDGIVGNAPVTYSPEVIRIHPDWVKSFNLPTAST